MRKIFNIIALSLLVALFSVSLLAQNPDSLTFVTAKAVANAEKDGIIFNNYLFEEIYSTQINVFQYWKYRQHSILT